MGEGCRDRWKEKALRKPGEDDDGRESFEKIPHRTGDHLGEEVRERTELMLRDGETGRRAVAHGNKGCSRENGWRGMEFLVSAVPMMDFRC